MFLKQERPKMDDFERKKNVGHTYRKNTRKYLEKCFFYRIPKQKLVFFRGRVGGCPSP